MIDWGGLDHLLPSCKGCLWPLGDILFVDELAIVVAASEAIVGIGGADTILQGEWA